MLRILKRPLVFALLIYLLSTCIDPFNIKLNDSKSLLVVDALITNENRSYQVKLSRSRAIQNQESQMVSGAVVSLRDNKGNSSFLQETRPGIYKTDSLALRGETGSSYVLSLSTPDGNQYESDTCLMYAVSEIESIYYKKDQEIINNGTETLNGIRIFLDSDNNNENKYFRWIYNEYWKFNVPYPKQYNYIDETTIIPVDTIKSTCWRNFHSNEIIIHSTSMSQTNIIKQKPMLFIASDKTNRLSDRYCLEINQLSISEKEYKFWEQMKQINDLGGNIFEKQPFSVISNIHNISNPSEPVLGYFQVSSLARKRVYIMRNEITDLGLISYDYGCDRIETGPGDYPPSTNPDDRVTFDKIYNWYIFRGSPYTFVEPIYNLAWHLTDLVFSQNECTDCTMTGSLKKPDFWIDR